MTPEELKQIRAGMGLSQAKLAEKIHRSLDTVKSWECGRVRIPDYVGLLLQGVKNESVDGSGSQPTE